MKKWYLIILLSVINIQWGFGYMEARPVQSNNQADYDSDNVIDRVNNAVYLAGQMTGFDYTEYDDNGDWLDEQSGFLWGGRAGISVTVNHIYFNAQLYATGGDTQYKGNVVDSSGQKVGVTDSDGINNIIVGSAKLGYSFDLTHWMTLTPFAEYGYRYWNRNINDGELDGRPVGGIREVYTTMYASGGLMFQLALTDDFVIGAQGSIGGLIAPNMEIKSGRFDGLDFDQGSSAIYQVGLNLNYFFTQSFSVIAGAEYVYFEFGKSNVVQSQGLNVWEPASVTHQGNGYIGLSYSF